MDFFEAGAELYIPDGVEESAALARTTHMGIGAHQDDLEIMAYDGILECFGQEDKWFCGVTVTNGAGSPRDALYADYTDDQMRDVRRVEQKKAAYVGEYSAQVLLDHSSSAVKDPSNPNVAADLKKLIQAANPEVIYTHNFADKHDTHVGVALRVVSVLRDLPAESRPQSLYACEVWRDLDWMVDDDKVAFDVEGHENLENALLGVFDSQNCGGKRYDLATRGRRVANATYHASHDVNVTQSMAFAMDITPLIQDDSLDIVQFISDYINRFAADVTDRIGRLT